MREIKKSVLLTYQLNDTPYGEDKTAKRQFWATDLHFLACLFWCSPTVTENAQNTLVCKSDCCLFTCAICWGSALFWACVFFFFTSLHLLFDHKIHLYSVCALCVSIFPFSIFACQMLDSIMWQIFFSYALIVSTFSMDKQRHLLEKNYACFIVKLVEQK